MKSMTAPTTVSALPAKEATPMAVNEATTQTAGNSPVIREGWDVYDREGRKVGVVSEVHREYLLVRHGHLVKKTTRFATDLVASASAGKARVDLSVQV
jgi:hypothetical protein